MVRILRKQEATPAARRHHHPVRHDTATQRHRRGSQVCLDPAVWGDVLPLPELALLAAIVVQAYRDVTRLPRSDTTRILQQEAWAFFAELGRLEWFCEFLDWNPTLLRAAVLSAKWQESELKR